MTLWLVLNGNAKSTMVKARRIDLDREPSPTVMADGLGGLHRRGWQYWLEQSAGDDVLAARPDVIPREAGPPDDLVALRP